MRPAALALALACGLAQAQPGGEGLPPPGAQRSFTPRVVQKTGPPVDIGELKAFTEQALRNGVSATREQCERLANGLWASTGDKESACLRYWAAGLTAGAQGQRAVVYFHGDVWSAGRAAPGYTAASDEALAKAAQDWARRLGQPYIFMARPGAYGSSGDHMERRRPAESRLVSAALDLLKQRMGIEEYVIVGFSGGGHLTSALATLRSDIVCAVPGGAPSSPALRWQLKHWTTDATGYGDSYDPSRNLRKESVHPQLRIFVVGDPRDREGLWPAQVVMAQAAREQGIPAEVIEVKGTPPDFHGGQGEVVRLVAGWCGQGMPTPDIVQRAWGHGPSPP